jgi:CheY-like chemotaxis protein
MNRLAKDLWLVVEDDDNDFLLFRRACARALEREPSIHRAGDGAAAKEFLAESRRPPCLIISDLKMPRMTGLELLAWVQQRDDLKRIPFVMLTSSHVEKDVAIAGQLGAADYQVKPSDFHKLVRLIKELGALQAAA